MNRTGSREPWPLSRAAILQIVCGVVLATGLRIVPGLLSIGEFPDLVSTGVNASYVVVTGLALWSVYLPRLSEGGRIVLAVGIAGFWATSIPSFIWFGMVSPYEVAALKIQTSLQAFVS